MDNFLMRRWLTLSFLIFSLSSCSDKDENSSFIQQAAIAATVFDIDVTDFRVAVFYEPGAEPYTGAAGPNDTWDITKESYEALFLNHTGRTVTVPATLGAMTAVADQNQTDWTVEELITLGQQTLSDISTGTIITMPVIFVEGRYEGSNSILGVHITGHPYAFIFKDVIDTVGSPGIQRQYVEQATVIHEVGHAIGLVNNGVPMVTNHEDVSHAKHSTNSNCVMYWAVESTSDIVNSLLSAILGNQTNLFGSESLADGRGYRP